MGRIEPTTVKLRDGATVVLRTVEMGDCTALIEHRKQIALTTEHNVTQPDELDTGEGRQREWIANHLERDGWLAIVAIGPTGELAGVLAFENKHDRRVLAHHGHFGISVEAAWRGRGVGTALIEVLLAWAAAHPAIEKVCLGVFANNHGARRLYHRLGFIEGRRIREFRIGLGQYVDDIQVYKFVKETG
jgi:RimJ/RimL family protein N-acetyltransferase